MPDEQFLIISENYEKAACGTAIDAILDEERVIDTQVPATCPLSTRNAFALLDNDTLAEIDHENSGQEHEDK